MDSFNKVISFVLGLVVVLVFLAVITGKINLKKKPASTLAVTPTPIEKKSEGFFGFFKPASPTSTQTPNPTQKPSSTVKIEAGVNGSSDYKSYNQTSGSSTPKSIPATGLPTLFIPALLSGVLAGSFLRKTDKKQD